MKKILLLIAVVMLAMTACRTNEANYRAAYEKAMERMTDSGDSTTTAGLRNSLTPKMMKIGTDSLPVLTIPVSLTSDSGGDSGSMKKYCIVVAKFRQVFNAKSMAQRLRDGGWTGAFVMHNRMADNYVVAASTNNPQEVAPTLERVKTDTTVVVRPPYPFVLRPAQLVR